MRLWIAFGPHLPFANPAMLRRGFAKPVFHGNMNLVRQAKGLISGHRSGSIL